MILDLISLIHTYFQQDWLPALWFFTVALEIGLYLMLDGADLGIGILSLFTRTENNRGIMMQVIGPIWDANETWLVVAAGTLFGAFPLAYGIILSALYIPVMILIFGLILRAVSFEFYHFAKRKHIWGRLFGIGSLMAAVGQGFLAGGLVSGIVISNDMFAGGSFDWATPIACGITVSIVIAYLITGRAYLLRRMTTSGALTRLIYPSALAVLAVAFGTVTIILLPNIVPPSITIYTAAASHKTLVFMLYGIGPLIPIIFAYNIYLYRVFSDERADDRYEV
ncbi:MAG: cytochrome d oxidase cyd, subunit [Parcubacteria group bacterium]|nr:cytochrome d oxidase cyd, subunit [Parcubacteria group bacterium]